MKRLTDWIFRITDQAIDISFEWADEDERAVWGDQFRIVIHIQKPLSIRRMTCKHVAAVQSDNWGYPSSPGKQRYCLACDQVIQ